MKKLIVLFVIFILALTLISCEWSEYPVQDVTPANDAIDIIAYAPGEYDADSTYYCLTTRYRECRITDYGTASFIDSIIPLRHQSIINLQHEYDELRHAAQSPKQ